MDSSLETKLKPQYLQQPIKEAGGIPVLLNENFISGDNGKYRKMYEWMSHGYDLAETVIGKLKYGNSINTMRAAIMSKLEWKDGSSVLYVSIGTGKNLQFIPASIDKKSLDITGIDLSMGMLKNAGENMVTSLIFRWLTVVPKTFRLGTINSTSFFMLGE